MLIVQFCVSSLIVFEQFVFVRSLWQDDINDGGSSGGETR